MVSREKGNPDWNNQDDDLRKHKYFLKEWFSGLLEGIKELDDETWPRILELTGRACARVHAVELFRETWKNSKDLDEFLVNINAALGEKVFSRIDQNQISATYKSCSCPLVTLELVDSPILCNCSPSWLIENFESVLDTRIDVSTEGTILQGSDRCHFILTLES
ncbi:MAG: hypothetical protein ACFFFG_07090 [Candidatus Thorarchaeota archaeon]